MVILLWVNGRCVDLWRRLPYVMVEDEKKITHRRHGLGEYECIYQTNRSIETAVSLLIWTSIGVFVDQCVRNSCVLKMFNAKILISLVVFLFLLLYFISSCPKCRTNEEFFKDAFWPICFFFFCYIQSVSVALSVSLSYEQVTIELGSHVMDFRSID